MGRRIYFLAVGGGGASLVCAQAPSPKALASTATIMIIFKSFNLSRLLSQQVAPVCLGGELQGSNVFLNFFGCVDPGQIHASMTTGVPSSTSSNSSTTSELRIRTQP